MRSFSRLIWLSIITSLFISDLAAKSNDLSQRHTYIVNLAADPVTTYKGGVKGLLPTHAKSVGLKKFNSKTAAAVAYRDYLEKKQADALNNVAKILKRPVTPKYQYFYSLNGFALELTAKEAEQLRTAADVKSIYIAPTHELETDRGPTIIRAPQVWQGVFNSTEARGEGVIIGVVDTGINHDHPSFAAQASDGYVHTNPLGPNTYLGQCVATPSLCNSKLIGSYNLVSGNTEPNDENGHGTHVAATAAGNLVQIGDGFELSGVAPRANIVSYKVGGADRSLSGAAISAAFDQAIADGVDVINYSAGTSSAYHPWVYGTQELNLREAGIVFVTSGGNSGPDNETTGTPANYPWVTSVASTTHDRFNFTVKQIGTFTGGDSAAPATITGQSITGSITAPIVYAGDYSNGDANPEQCLNPFPPGTFSGQIVVCDRGSIARADKAKNVAAGGAGGFVLANIDGGETSLANDVYEIPGIHIAAADGNSLKAWLASGTGHTATITAIGTNSRAADVVSNFSSRGPNDSVDDIITGTLAKISAPIDVLVPNVAAPGQDILAADVDPIDFGFKSGTSMASPHVAGAAALLIQLHPTWSPSAIHSALATTAETQLITHIGEDADSFDIGGGRIDIPNALNAGLLLEETVANFTAANPDAGGDPRSLNLPSVTNSECLISCTWTRTFTAVEGNTWNAVINQPTNATISVTPASFTLTAGQTQEVEFSASISGAAHKDWLFGAVRFEPTGGTVGATRIPVTTRALNSTLKGYFEGSNETSAGSLSFSNVESIASSDPVATGSLVRATEVTLSIEQDSNNSSPYDDASFTDGVEVRTIVVPSGSPFLVVKTSNSSATDMDLFVGRDLNGNGRPEQSEELDSSTTSTANEEIRIENPVAGTYWVLVQNWDGSVQAQDSIELTMAAIPSETSTNLSFDLPATLDGTTPFNITMNWSDLNPVNTEWYGVVRLGNSSDDDFLGTALFKINRGATPDSTGGGDSGGDSGGSSGGGGNLGFATLLLLLAGLRRRYRG